MALHPAPLSDPHVPMNVDVDAFLDEAEDLLGPIMNSPNATETPVDGFVYTAAAASEGEELDQLDELLRCAEASHVKLCVSAFSLGSHNTRCAGAACSQCSNSCRR